MFLMLARLRCREVHRYAAAQPVTHQRQVRPHFEVAEADVLLRPLEPLLHAPAGERRRILAQSTLADRPSQPAAVQAALVPPPLRQPLRQPPRGLSQGTGVAGSQILSDPRPLLSTASASPPARPAPKRLAATRTVAQTDDQQSAESAPEADANPDASPEGFTCESVVAGEHRQLPKLPVGLRASVPAALSEDHPQHAVEPTAVQQGLTHLLGTRRQCLGSRLTGGDNVTAV